MTDDLVTPLPSVAAAQGPFLIEALSFAAGGYSAAPAVDSPGRYGAPLGREPEERAIRFHEYGHLALFRSAVDLAKRPCRLSNVWRQATLDVVVNSFMIGLGCWEIALLIPILGPLRLDVDLPPSTAASLWLRAEMLDCASSLRPKLESAGRLSACDAEFLKREAAQLQRLGFMRDAQVARSTVIKSARRLQRRFGPGVGELPIEEIWTRASGRPITSAPDLESNQWGSLEIVDATEPDARTLTRFLGRRPGFTGPFRYPHRALVTSDGRAWATRRKLSRDGCGSILVDCSGSMSLPLEAVSKVVERLPAITVAAYASVPQDLSRGRLIVLARRGRILRPNPVHIGLLGHGNVVDGPALRWLSHESPPRIWVSDGVVTGRQDRTAPNLRSEVDQIRSRFAIRCLASIEECLKGIATRPATGLSLP
jgi:hypothetical protein